MSHTVPPVQVAAERIASELAGEAEEEEEDHPNTNGSAKRRARKEKAREGLEEAEEKGLELWEKTKSYLLRPGVAGGLLGVGE